MDDLNKGVSSQPAEVETPVTETPSVEPKTSPEEVVTAEKPVETPITESETEQLPSDQSEQAKAFQAMRQEIKELKTKVEEKKNRQSLFDQGQALFTQPKYQTVDPNQFIDPSTGFFNKPAYEQTVQQVNAYNQRVATTTASETVDHKLDEWKARQKHPELNTNRKFERAVANEYQAQLIESAYDPSARAKSIEEIADDLAPFYKVDQKKMVQQVTANVQQQLTAKEQASLNSAGRSQPGASGAQDLLTLQKRTRQGDLNATVARLRNLKKA